MRLSDLTNDRKSGKRLVSNACAFALEPRILFDAAAVATADATLASSEPNPSPTETATEHGDVQSLLDAAAAFAPVDQTSPLTEPRTEVLFIENNVAEYQTLIDGAKAGVEIHVLDASQNGLTQMAGILGGRSGIDAIHIVSHGSEASFGLGSLIVTMENLHDQSAELTVIGNALEQDADILLYGCNVAKGSVGASFIEALASLSQADIAASTNATGSAILSGDWDLESSTGYVSSTPFISDSFQYNHVLAAPRVLDGGASIFVRPGGTSYTWTYGVGLTPPGLTTNSAITDIDYHNADFPPTGSNSGEDWVLVRGKFQYSTDGGSNWSDYAYPANGNTNFVSVAGKIWRFVDNLPGDTTTSNSIGNAYYVTGHYGQSVGTGSSIIPDNAPTNIVSDKSYFLSDTTQGTAVATLTPTDTGLTTGGYWEIDSQSVANLFTISSNTAAGNTATLSLGSGTMPGIGQTATVTARYYDLYQTDTSGNPVNGQGFSKTFTFTVVDGQSQDLNFGNDLNVSTTATNDQLSPSVTTLSNGNFVTVWQSAGQGGEAADKNGIYGQIYDATGAVVGSEFAITAAGNGIDEITPAVSALDNGRFAVAYLTTPGANGLDVAYRIVEANGTVGSQLIANTTVANDQYYPTITTLTDGSFVIAWTDYASNFSSGRILVQKFNAADGSKNGSEVTIAATGLNVSPSLAALSNGAYVVAWGDGTAYNINAVVSTAPSTVISVTSDGGAFSVDSFFPLPRVVGLVGGGFVVAWDSYANDLTNYAQTDIFFQRYNNAGTAQGSITQVNTTTGTGTYKYEASIAALSLGGFVVGWQSDTGDYDLNGIFGRRFSSTGVAVDATDFEINQYRRGDQNSPVLTALASDMFATVWVDNTSDTTSAGIEARVLLPSTPVPSITSATYDASSNTLVVTGADLEAQVGVANDIDVTKLTLTGQGGATYTLTSSNVEIDSATQFTVVLNAADQINVEGLLNKNGTSSVGGTTFNIAAAANWNVAVTGAADLTGNGITVSNVQTPTITSSTYDASAGTLVVTGTNLVKASGATNDITANKFTLTGEGGVTYTLTDTSNVEITSATAFTITLSATDKAAINQILNKNGTSSTGATTYNLAAADDWNTVIGNADIADATGNGITVSNVAAPTITSMTYDASTGSVVVTGTGFLKLNGATNDIVANKFTFTGEGGATYTLTDTANVEISSGTAFTLVLSATDKAAINQLINKNGTSSTGGTTYNLAAAEDWAAGADAALVVADLTGNGNTTSNVAVPTITSSAYDASSGTLVVTGTGFLKLSGATNDIVANKVTFTGEGGATYTLTDTANVEISSGTAFTLVLSATDKAAINQIINKNGTSSTSGTTYNLAAAEDWAAGADAAVVVADLTGNGITTSNVAVPAITSASYDYNTNTLVVTGTGFLSKSGATNDIDLTKLTFTGEAGATYTLTNATGVEITSPTSFSVTLSGAELTNVEALLNKDGTSSVSATTYNLASAAGWNRGDATNGSDNTNAITVSNYAAPTVTSATYDASTNVLTVTGTNLVSKSGASNDVAVSLLTLTGEGGSYTLTSSDVEITDSTTFSVSLNAADQIAVRGLLNKNGTSSASATTYNLAGAEDWMAASAAATVVADLTGNGITVSNVPTPTITSATYDSDTGVLAVAGTNLFSKVGANNDIDLTKLTFTGEGAGTYTLTSGLGVEITSATSFTTTLTGADKTAVDALLNKIGTSSNDATTYNLAAADDWLGGADPAANIADAVNAVTVSIAPKISSASYDASTGTLVVTGSNMQATAGAANDITANKLTLTGEGGVSYTLTDTANVELTSASSFTLTLSATDQAAINQIVNKNGTSSTGGTTYNLAVADDWNAQVSAGDTSDLTGNGITASNVATPTITSMTYNAATGSVVVTGTGFLKLNGANNDIVANQFTFTGEGGATYTLTDTANVEISSGTSFTLVLSSTDKAAINQLINKNGTASTGGTTYNLAAAEDWAAGADAAVVVADLTGNGLTAGNVAVPTITGMTYDAGTGSLVVTGTGFLKLNGASNDIVANKFTFTGEGGATYTLTDTANVEISSGTSFTLLLSATDQAAINQLINKNGTSSTGGTTYNLAAAEDWAAGADAAVVVADLTGNGLTAGNVAVPTITGMTYDAGTGSVVVTGTGFLKLNGASNDIVANKFTFTGEGGATYTLTDTANVEISSGTSFTLVLSATDKAAINQIINKNGTNSTGGTTYNLAAAEDWAAGADAAVVVADLTGNGVTTSNVAVPTITGMTYDAGTGSLVVTGTGFLKLNGTNNDIVANKFTFTGEGGATYTLTDTANVEITSGTAFTLVLSATDKAAINQLINKNGTNSTGGTTYNLAAAEDWAAGADAAVVVADLTGNGITSSNVAVPTITSMTYDAATGSVVVTGTGFLKLHGAANDIVANKFTFTGEGGATYTLTDTANVEISSGTSFTLVLSATDKAAINQIINKNGSSSTGGTTYNMAAAEDWAAGADAAVVVADLTGNGIVASVNNPPLASDASFAVDGNGNRVFSVADFHFSDTDNGDSLQSITILSLPASGSLTLNGAAVIVNQSISVAALNAGQLVFTPADNVDATVGFGFSVNDGTADSVAYTHTLNVIAASTTNATQTVDFNAGNTGLRTPASSTMMPVQTPVSVVVVESGVATSGGLGGGLASGGGSGQAGGFAGSPLGGFGGDPAVFTSDINGFSSSSTGSQTTSLQMETQVGAGNNSFTMPAEALLGLDTSSGIVFAAAQANGSSLPAWIRFDPATGNLSLKEGAVEKAVIKITATDGKGNQTVITVVLKPKATNAESRDVGSGRPAGGRSTPGAQRPNGASESPNQPRADVGKIPLSEQMQAFGKQGANQHADALLQHLSQLFGQSQDAA